MIDRKQRQSLGVVLMFEIGGQIERAIVVPVARAPFFQEGRIGNIAGAQLHLPVFGKELLVFPENSSARLFGWFDLRAQAAEFVLAFVVNEEGTEGASKA